MTTPGLVMCVPMLALVTWAAAVDVRQRRIPNWITFSLILTGFAQSFTWSHTVSPTISLAGFLAGFGLTFILFAMGAIGGGDVKLIAGIGAWLGPLAAILIFATEAIIGMIIVLVQASYQRRLTRLLQNSAVLAVNLAYGGEATTLEDTAAMGKACSGGAIKGRPLPYAVPVFIATILHFILH